ncbi:MAG: NAD(P)H-dependent oxidoreductase [Hymenobacter sp.]
MVAKLVAANPGSTVQVHDLANKPFPHLEEAHLKSFFTPTEHRSPEQQQAIRHSDEAIAEIMAADTIVIGAPSTISAFPRRSRRGLTTSPAPASPSATPVRHPRGW